MRKLKSVAYYVVAWSFCCAAFLLIRYLDTPNPPLPLNILAIAVLQFALLTGLMHGIYEVYILDDDRFHRSAMESLIVRSTYTSVLILSSLMMVALINNNGVITTPSLSYQDADVWIFSGYAFLVSWLIIFTHSVHKKFGTRVFINTWLGKRQNPQEEERVFIFLDLRSATSIAEELGHFSYSAFLRDYFRLVSDCCAESGGEVYQYAGDGVILTWPMSACRSKPRPLIFLRYLVARFRKASEHFARHYKVVPQFKAAIHVGRVIATEVGNFGSAIAYHGDTLNTTARLQSLCNLLKKDFLLTESFLHKMPHLRGFEVRAHGSFQLRGKHQDLEVFSVHWPGAE